MNYFSLKKKLMILYGFIILIPIVIISLFMPSYYQTMLEKETQSLTENTLTALSHNIDMYLDELGRITTLPYFNNDLMEALILKTSKDYDQLNLSKKVFVEQTLTNSLSTYFQNIREDITGTVILPEGGSVYVRTRFGSAANEFFPFKDQDWYKETVAADGKATFISAHSPKYLVDPPADKVFSVARLIKNPVSQKPVGVIMADEDSDVIRNLMGDVHFNVDSIRVVLDQDGEVFYSSNPLSDDMIAQIKQKESTIKSEEDSYVPVSAKIKQANWQIVVLLSKSQLANQVKWIYLVGILFAIAGIIVTIFLFNILSKWIVNPHRRMIHAMEKVQQGDLTIQLESKGNDELAQLALTFNRMIEQINELIDREYKAVINQRNAEYRALQSQIQPHFLFNTLNGFIALNRLGEKTVLEKAIFSLSSMLRYTLGQEDWTTVKDSFTFLKQYCDLQQLRFQDRLEIEITADEGTHSFQIPKLLLQPIVENAIIHGIEPADRLCKLIIASELEETFLVITIHDNGIGFDPQTVKKSSSIGISNVKERLEMAYPHSVFMMESEIGKGTRITIKIPLEDVRM